MSVLSAANARCLNGTLGCQRGHVTVAIELKRRINQMQHFRQLNSDVKEKYLFKDRSCLGRRCWSPGIVQTGNLTTPCCVISACEDGCPSPIPAAEQTLVSQRRAQGWVTA